jgi:hypothetical protein
MFTGKEIFSKNSFEYDDKENVLFFEKSILKLYLVELSINKTVTIKEKIVVINLFFESFLPFCFSVTKIVSKINNTENPASQKISFEFRMPFEAWSKCHAKLKLFKIAEIIFGS